MEQGEKLSRIFLHSIRILNSVINLRRRNFGVKMEAAILMRNFYVNVGRAASKTCRATWIYDAHSVSSPGTPRKILIDLAGHGPFGMRTGRPEFKHDEMYYKELC
jgi:hypothetical protein